VTVLPSFFLVAAVLGGMTADLRTLVVWVAVVFVSVLLHELGHSAMGLAFGLEPSVLLHGMGGTTSWRSESSDGMSNAVRTLERSESSDGTSNAVRTLERSESSDGTSKRPRGALSPGRSIAISLAGPCAGFVVGAVVLGLGAAGAVPRGTIAAMAYRQLLWVNVGWGILNLLPMLPLDGGNVLTQALQGVTKGHGERPARVISLVVAGAGGLFAAWVRDWWPALLAGWFAAINWQALQAMRAREAAPPAPPAGTPSPPDEPQQGA